jgi:hypothetical protein
MADPIDDSEVNDALRIARQPNNLVYDSDVSPSYGDYMRQAGAGVHDYLFGLPGKIEQNMQRPQTISPASLIRSRFTPQGQAEASRSFANFAGNTAQGIYNDTITPFGQVYRGELDPEQQKYAAMKVAASLLGLGAGTSALAGAGEGTVLRSGMGPTGKATQLPNIRNMTIQDAIKTAKSEPHLIQAPESSQSYYVGGPREVQSAEDLARQRAQFDAHVAQDPRGADWYDRYRSGVREVTGDQPKDNLWMANQEAQWSAGVSPEAELGFALKENNASLMGMPVKSARPAQHEAHLRAIAANDPSLYQLGAKTGEYAHKINPDQPIPPGATGVNDFRYAREWGYTEPGGEAQRNALTSAQHSFMDYETALAIDRANQAQVGGRSDWTGEKIQAAPWVRQKANDILDQRPNLIKKYTDKGIDPETARIMAYEDAFDIAKNTITDYFPKHTAFATHEAMPGADTGHLPGSIGASQAEREAYSADPRSSWANAPGNRDAIYGGLRLGDTGVAARVLPTTKMTGMYTPPSGITEFNPGEVARPLVSFQTSPTGAHELPRHDRAMLEAGEGVRAYIDAQNAGAAHKVQFVAPGSETTSFSLPMDRQATPEELKRISAVGAKHGLPDVVDTGQGLSLTRFYPEPNEFGKGYTQPIGPTISGAPLPSDSMASAKKIAQDVLAAAPQAKSVERVKIDSVYQNFVDEWQQGIGSGAATRKMLDSVNVTPEARSAFNNNPYIPQNALNRLERDEDWKNKWGVTRIDIQNARRIISQGPGWIDRLEKALKSGAVLPAVAGAAILAGTVARGDGQNVSQ